MSYPPPQYGPPGMCKSIHLSMHVENCARDPRSFHAPYRPNLGSQQQRQPPSNNQQPGNA